MLSHYLSIALRNLRRAPFIASINVLTLALGLVAFVAAYAIVGYWDNSEGHFSNAERTFVITSNLALADGSAATGTWPWTNDLYERYLRVEFPEFEAIAKANPWSQEASVTAEGRGARVSAVAVDPEFLDIFDLPFIAGDPATALRRPDGILLSEAAAIRLFGSTEALGKTVTLGGNLVDASVTGVIGAMPQPSHMGDSATAVLQLELIASYPLYERLVAALNTPAAPPAPGDEGDETEAAPEQAESQAASENWFSNYNLITYVMLKRDSGLSATALNDRLGDFVERRLTPEMLAFASAQAGAVPVSGLMVTHLNAQLLGSASGAVSITTLLFAAGALVLLVACVNYANLAAARSVRRAREIGLRKVLGARRGQIVAQHLSEAGLLAAAALALAVFIVNLLAPVIRGATDIDIGLSLFAGTGFWLFMAVLLAGVTLAAGGYPALVLSRARPVEALRLGRLRLGPRLVSTILVGTQFVAASLLVIAVIVMSLQNAALRRTGLGATADPYLVINNFSPVTGVDNELLWQELERLSQVKGVTQMGQAPWAGGINISTYARTREEADASQTHTAFSNGVGYDFFSTFDMTAIAGRVFDRGRNDLPPQGAEPDPSTPRNIVIDRAYAAQLGFASPEQAVDALLYGPNPFGPEPPQRVIGVVENRPLQLRGAGTTANVYFLGPGANMTNQIVRLSAQDVAGALSAIEAAWRRLGPEAPFTYRFMDDLFEENYRNFARINQAFAGLALFALVISFIGLFGMAIQSTGRRLHEIGVRKSLGAGTVGIAAMLLRDFSKPVVIANLIAWPLAFIAAQTYLSIFIQRIDLTPLPFVLSLGFVLAVAWAAVASQVLRAANVNPATVLRFE